MAVAAWLLEGRTCCANKGFNKCGLSGDSAILFIRILCKKKEEREEEKIEEKNVFFS
jgi:hypothetical protein